MLRYKVVPLNTVDGNYFVLKTYYKKFLTGYETIYSAQTRRAYVYIYYFIWCYPVKRKQNFSFDVILYFAVMADATKGEKWPCHISLVLQQRKLQDLKGLKNTPELALSPRQVCNTSVK